MIQKILPDFNKVLSFVICFIMFSGPATINKGFAQCGENWEWQNPLPQEHSLNDVHVLNNDTAFAVGENGTVIKTTDGGDSWDITHCAGGTNNMLRSLHFPDANNGWAVGDHGTIIHTTDGGNTWNSQPSGVSMFSLSSIYFADANTGWAVGQFGTIVHTTNGGSTWNSQSSGTTKRFNSVHFTNANTGWAVGDSGTVVHTTNGGSSWSSQAVQIISFIPSVSLMPTLAGP